MRVSIPLIASLLLVLLLVFGCTSNTSNDLNGVLNSGISSQNPAGASSGANVGTGEATPTSSGVGAVDTSTPPDSSDVSGAIDQGTGDTSQAPLSPIAQALKDAETAMNNGQTGADEMAKAANAADEAANKVLLDPNATILDILDAIKLAQLLGSPDSNAIYTQGLKKIIDIINKNTTDPRICKKEMLYYAASAQGLEFTDIGNKLIDAASKVSEYCQMAGLSFSYNSTSDNGYGEIATLTFSGVGSIESDNNVYYHYKSGTMTWKYTSVKDLGFPGASCLVREHKDGSGIIDLSSGKRYADSGNPVSDVDAVTVNENGDVFISVSAGGRYYVDDLKRFILPPEPTEGNPTPDKLLELRVWYEQVNPPIAQVEGQTPTPCDPLPKETREMGPPLDFALYDPVHLTPEKTSAGTVKQGNATLTWDLRFVKNSGN